MWPLGHTPGGRHCSPLKAAPGSADNARMDLDTLLRRAVGLGATDVHFKEGQPPILRRDGSLEPMDGIGTLALPHLEDSGRGRRRRARLRAFHNTGDLDLAYQSADLPRFRVSAFRQRGAISPRLPRDPEAGADVRGPEPVAGVERLTHEHRGLVAVTGASGSGKTTTLAAMIGEINRTRRQHIVTIEDPIEILHADDQCIVEQREVGLDTESFEQALRRALRQDPDVILIGELRDAETAQTALQAAESVISCSTMRPIGDRRDRQPPGRVLSEAKQVQIRSITAGVTPKLSASGCFRVDGGRIAAVRGDGQQHPVRIADLIRELRTDEIQAIAEGSFFDMQTFTQALIDHVLAGTIDEVVAADASSNRHDFLVALERRRRSFGSPPRGRPRRTRAPPIRRSSGSGAPRRRQPSAG